MMNRIKLLCAFGLLLLIIAGCDPSKKYRNQESSQIQSYIQSLGDTVYVLKPSGLYYIELQEGTGRTPIVNDTVAFWYKAMFLDRVVFDSNASATGPFYAVVGTYQILDGLDEGVRYMKEGGKARLLTPSSLAYGANGAYPVIPGYTPLLWEIELVSVKAGSKK
jgi:FKBP-type peptidyl-prolyl cis-trans isomerase